MFFIGGERRAISVALAAALGALSLRAGEIGPAAGTSSPVQGGDWSPVVSLSADEYYDSNVYIYEFGELAGQDSMVTQIEPEMGVRWKDGDDEPSDFLFAYHPRFTWFHSEPSEDHITHSVDCKHSGHSGIFSWEATGRMAYVDGDRQGLLFLGPGGAPAIGGFQVRDRRESFLAKETVRLRWDLGPVFVRPQAEVYIHDFMTIHQDLPGYCNYLDRERFECGADAGVAIAPGLWLVGGYRAGIQKQDTTQWHPVHYSNDYQRALAGLEGEPLPWLKLSFLIGPSFHRFNDTVAPYFSRNQNRVFVDACLTLKPTRWDTCAIKVGRYEEMISSACGAYEDIQYRANWEHRFTDAVSAAADFWVYRGEFEAPHFRDDTIYTPSVRVSWKINRQLSATAGYTYQWVESDLPATPAREYYRNEVRLGIKAVF